METGGDRPLQLAFYGACRTDADADGVAGFIYDGQSGDLTDVEYDRDNDGAIDGVRTFTYYADGNLQQIADDDDNNGIVDETNTYVFDADGNLDRIERDSANDGIVDYVAVYTWGDAPLNTQAAPAGTPGDMTDAESPTSAGEDESGGAGCFLQSLP